MNPSSFSASSPGSLVPVSGVRGITHAFRPDGLPPGWEFPADLWPLLTEARVALADLNGVGRYLPNPDLVLRPLQNREAQKSSSLEGTYTEPEEQMLFELDPELPSDVADPRNARREVSNYAQALRLRRSADDLPLSLRLIRVLHGVLMDGVRGSDRAPGEFRRLQNQIGRPPRFVPPPANLLDSLLGNFEKYLHADDGLDPLVRAFVAHYQFETIHPFMDGNGRVGRLLLAISIEEWCGLSAPWLYMSDFFDSHKDDYIDLMFGVSSKGDWNSWIRFCLEGVVAQSRDTAARCGALIELNRDFHERVNAMGASTRLSALVDELFLNPITTPVTGLRLGAFAPRPNRPRVGPITNGRPGSRCWQELKPLYCEAALLCDSAVTVGPVRRPLKARFERGGLMSMALRYTEAEYEAAIAEIERLLDEDVEAGSEGYDRLEFLSVLVEHYEDAHYPMGSVSPQQAVLFMLEQKGLERSDLDDVMGGKSRVSEFLNGKRDLSKTQVEALRKLLGIPADVLLGLDG
jgi:Fic family protein/antitoxin component HigA of HigAB toxin-antitoxin module